MRIIQMLMATSAAAMMQPASANHIHDERHKEPSPIAPPGPVQEGAPFDRCYAWILAAPGDTCHSIESKVGLPHGLLRGYNAQLHGDCDNNLWAGYYYCWGLTGSGPGMTHVDLPHHKKKHDCKGIVHDDCASAVFAGKETPKPMVDWCKRYLGGPTCTETRPEGIFSSYDGFPKRAMASSLCATPSALPMAPRFSKACQCFTQMHPHPTG